MAYLLQLLAGVICAGVGGELFVRGLREVSCWARVSTAIIGATIAAFGTSSAELAVGIGAAIARVPQVSFGDVLGSNVVNLALILALAIALSGTQGVAAGEQRNFLVAFLAPAITGLLVLDGVISRGEGVLLLIVFVIWFALTARAAYQQRCQSEGTPGSHSGRFGVVLVILGLALLLLSGRLVVNGAKGIAAALGINEFIIGATIVAFGTSTPELATTIVAHRRGHAEIGLSMMLGSNIFNNLMIVGLVATITPIPVVKGETLSALISGILAVVLVWPSRSGTIGRWRAVPLFCLYALYVVVTYFLRGGPH